MMFPAVRCRLGEPMKNHTSFRIGGTVRAMFFPGSADELAGLCAALRDRGTEPLILGNGTNILADDKPLDIVVVKTTGLCDIARTGDAEITAGAGILLSKLAAFACEQSLSGLEFAHGIPGTLGGAVAMNAGAYGGEMKDVVRSTRALGADDTSSILTGEEHGFSYRRSILSQNNDIALSSVIKLKKGGMDAIKSLMSDLSARRRENQPLDLPSAGSAFKRPKGGYAAKLIEQAGLKGFAIGGAQVSAKHSGFIVNMGDASFSDVIAVVEHVQETVYKQFSIKLEPEIKIVQGPGKQTGGAEWK